mmetsp:Transcript_1229/g.5308  ORF Transcript_1229/g.5308 Transcript_1229/m.5308 type:complete len:381 (-) Transcript_1229:1124-2266(-)
MRRVAFAVVRSLASALGAARDALPRAPPPIGTLGAARRTLATSALGHHGRNGTLPWIAVDDAFARSVGAGRGATRSAMGSTRGFAAEALKVYKPTSPGQRGRITTSRDHLWRGKPLKALTVGLRKKGGRNNQGRITVWHQGGGHKRLYRIIDMKRRATTAAGTVRRIEYDPNRSTRIALVDFLDDAKRTKPCYVLAPEGVKPGSTIVASTDGGVDIRPGNAMPLREIPPGTQIHNIELRPGQGGVLVRAAGTCATLVKKSEIGTGGADDGYATVRLPSGEQRLVLLSCMATVGTLSNAQHANRVLGKAGAVRWLGVRPTTRGVAMNPVDHPHGGGEGRTSGGRPSVTPWGVYTKGTRTRNNKRTDNMRVARRPTGKKKKK